MTPAALAATALLVLGACSDDAGGPDSDGAAPGTETADPQTSPATEEPDDTTGTTGPTTGTEDPTDTGTESPTDTGTAQPEAVVPVEEANSAAVRVLTAARLARTGSGQEAAQARDDAFSGQGLQGAGGAHKLRDVAAVAEGGDPLIDPTEANVLAVSRDDGEHPWLMVVQTVPDTGQPVLHLLNSPDDADAFRIINSAPMLSGTEVGGFHPRGVGSPVVREGRGDLPVEPEALLGDFASLLDYPSEDGDGADIRTNGYAPQVRDAADEQAEEVSVQADFTQEHRVMPKTIRTIERANGSALVFAVLERTDTFDVHEGMTLNAPEMFTALVEDQDQITEEAAMTTLEFVVLEVPAGDEAAPRLLAVREQLVGAQGE